MVVSYISIAILAVLGILLLFNKDRLIIGYYNIKQNGIKKYDKKRLSIVLGIILLLMALVIYIGTNNRRFSIIYLPLLIFVLIYLFIVLPSFICLNPKYVENRKKKERIDDIITNILVSLIFLTIGIFGYYMMYTGYVEVDIEKENIKLSSSYYKNSTISYDEIVDLDVVEDVDLSNKLAGHNNIIVKAGKYQNKRHGTFNLYAYERNYNYIKIVTEEDVYIFNGRNKQHTYQIYSEITSHLD